MRLGLSLAVVLVAGSLGAFAGLQVAAPTPATAGYSPGLVATAATASDDESVSEGWQLIESIGMYGWASIKLAVTQNYARFMRSFNQPAPVPATKDV